MSDEGTGGGEIRIEERLPHSPETVWNAITTGTLIERWMGMEPEGFSPVVGTRFRFRTKPAGQWDGTIECEVLEAIENKRFAYSWVGGHSDNQGYGSALDTVVTFDLERCDGNTLLTLVHSGFKLPRNQVAIENMGKGWAQCAVNLRDIAND